MTVLNFNRAMRLPPACRTCRERRDSSVNVFPAPENQDPNSNAANRILNALRTYCPITITEDDGLGSLICVICVFDLQLMSQMVLEFNAIRQKVKELNGQCCFMCAKQNGFFFMGYEYRRMLRKVRQSCAPNAFVKVKEPVTALKFCKNCAFKLDNSYRFQQKAKVNDRKLRYLPYNEDFSSDPESDVEYEEEPLDGWRQILKLKNVIGFSCNGYTHMHVHGAAQSALLSASVASTSTAGSSSASTSSSKGGRIKKKTVARKKRHCGIEKDIDSGEESNPVSHTIIKYKRKPSVKKSAVNVKKKPLRNLKSQSAKNSVDREEMKPIRSSLRIRNLLNNNKNKGRSSLVQNANRRSTKVKRCG